MQDTELLVGHGATGLFLLTQVEATVVDEPQVVVFKGSFKLAAEPRGVARSAALAAAEMVLVSSHACPGTAPVSQSGFIACTFTSTARTADLSDLSLRMQGH